MKLKKETVRNVLEGRENFLRRKQLDLDVFKNRKLEEFKGGGDDVSNE